MTEAFVTAVSLPSQLDTFFEMLDKNLDRDFPTPHLLDAEILLDPGIKELSWSVPTWARPGDIAIFYCTLRALRVVEALKAEIPEQPTWIVDGTPAENRELRDLMREGLNRAEHLYGQVGGKFVAVGQVNTLPGYGWSPHVRDRTVSKITPVVRLKSPIQLSALRGTFTVRRAATTTRMTGTAYRKLQALLATEELPEWATGARIGREALPKNLQGNWRQTVVSDLYRPRTEDELRELVVHPFLDELADDGIPVLHECRCYRGKQRLGIIDSMLSFNGAWIAVEAKLHISAWDRLAKQLRRYLRATRSHHVEEDQLRTLRLPGEAGSMLVLDGQGLSAVSRAALGAGGGSHPAITFAQLTALTRDQLRNRVAELLT